MGGTHFCMKKKRENKELKAKLSFNRERLITMEISNIITLDMKWRVEINEPEPD